MSKLFGKLRDWEFGSLSAAALFFIAFYFYLWVFIDIRLFYHGGLLITNFPVFFKGWTFFRDFLFYPGGIFEYSFAFLVQFFHFAWLGALIVTAQAVLMTVCVDAYLTKTKLSKIRWMSFLPTLILVVIYSRFTYHFTTTMAYLVSLACAVLYLQLKSEKQFVRAVWFFLVSVIFYYAAGGAFLVFATLCGLYELFSAGRIKLAASFFLSAVIVPYAIGVNMLGVSFADAFTSLLPISREIIAFPSQTITIEFVYALFLFLPFVVVVSGLWQAKKNPERTKAKSKSKKVTKLSTKILMWYKSKLLLKWSVKTAILLFLLMASACFSYDDKRKVLFEIAYHSNCENWEKILSAATRNKRDYFVIHMVNRALYHVGRLGEAMLDYTQNPSTLILSAKQHVDVYGWKYGVYFDLGHMNFAEHYLVNSLETFGEQPFILKKLAKVKMARSNMNAAKVYLGALNKTLFDDVWAKKYLAKIETDPELLKDTEIQKLRSRTTKKDHSKLSFTAEDICQDLLSVSDNRMAFEYLMSWYLLGGELDKFSKQLHRVNDFGFNGLPRLYEEALLVYIYFTNKPFNLSEYKISVQTQRNFENFRQILARYGSNKAAAYKELAAKYGNTYMFYFIYGHSGVKSEN